jgi:hypothetical protein
MEPLPVRVRKPLRNCKAFRNRSLPHPRLVRSTSSFGKREYVYWVYCGLGLLWWGEAEWRVSNSKTLASWRLSVRSFLFRCLCVRSVDVLRMNAILNSVLLYLVVAQPVIQDADIQAETCTLCAYCFDEKRER